MSQPTASGAPPSEGPVVSPPAAGGALAASGEGSLQRRILLGLLAGALAGVAANWLGHRSLAAGRVVEWLIDGVAHPLGQVFLRLLFLVVLPLVFASLAAGVARLGELHEVGRLGARTLAFFLATSACAVAIGLLAMGLFRPGEGFDQATRESLLASFGGEAARVQAASSAADAGSLRALVDRVLDAFLPRNVLAAVVQMQMLPLIVAALLIGVALTRVAEPRRWSMLVWLDTVSDAMVRIVELAMRFAPLAVACLIFEVAARFGADLLLKLAVFVALVLASYVVQLALVYPLLLRLLTRRPAFDVLRRCVPVMVTAFSTSSSSATLPTSIRVAESALGVRSAVAGFVLPLGATMNMNGTALFEGAVVLFVAQAFGVELHLGQQVLVVLLCVLASVGAAGVPGGSLPLLMIVMAQVGVPPDGIALVLGVDRLLDMGRTVVNVTGDLVCAVWIEEVEVRAPR